MTNDWETILDEDGARVRYRAAFLSAEERDALYAELEGARGTFDHDVITIFGRTIPSPRLVAAYGDPGTRYRYSGVVRVAQPWLPALRGIRDRIADIASQPFTYALVNLYRDGRDRLGWHADDENDIVRDSCIASVSIGAERPFQLRRRSPKGSPTRSVTLGDGSLLFMEGATQRLFTHQLPARARIDAPRFNVTLRWMR